MIIIILDLRRLILGERKTARVNVFFKRCQSKTIDYSGFKIHIFKFQFVAAETSVPMQINFTYFT